MAAGLRVWARGCYAEEAAVELLVRAFGGRLAASGCPWVRPGARPGRFSLDPDAISKFSRGLSGAEQRVLAVVAALAGNQPVNDLPAVLSGIDRPHLGLILAALAHAGGSHQQSDLLFARDGSCTVVGLPALVGWPGAADAGAASRGVRAA